MSGTADALSRGSRSFTPRHRPMQVLERLEEHAASRPHAPAVRIARGSSRSTMTYGELALLVHNFAGQVEAGVPAGGVVAIAAASGPGFAAAFLGTLRAGRIVHPVPRNSTPSELASFVRATRADLLVSDGAIAAVGLDVPCMALSCVGEGSGGVGESWRSIDQASPGLYLPSSGTTGLPKIAVRSRQSLDAVAANVASAVDLRPDDVVLAAVPMSHSYGMENGLLGPIWAGACIHVVEPSGTFDTGELPAELERGGITVFPAVPFMIEVLSKLEAVGRSSLRCVYTAGSPLPSSVAADFVNRYGIQVGQLYGATEVGSVTFAGPGETTDLACVGRPLGGVCVTIVDTETPSLSHPAPMGTEGHVAIRAESMLSHYLGGDRSDPAFLDDHFLTGDLGYVDEHGRLTITGRLKLLIDVGGFKVNPLEVERTLLEHPSVGEVAVLPVRVTDTVSRVRALIVPRSGSVALEDLRAFAKQRLSPHKVPRVFEVVTRLPKSPMGKILRRELEHAT
jgi:long-chain acyl-CoA synthetase